MISKFAFRYTQEHITFLTEGYMKMGVIKLALAFNEKFGTTKSADAINSLLKNRGIKCGRGTGELMKGKSKLFSQEQIDFIKSNYGPMSRKELLTALNAKFGLDIKLNQLVSFVKNHNIKSGRTGHFKKGQPSWSKGTKGVLKANSGSFKKGQTPHNHVPIGSERVNSDGYHEIKIAEPNIWRGKHSLMWEEVNGPIPDEHFVRFADGDKNNLSLDNFILVNRSEHHFLNRNGHKDAPDEVKETILLVSKLQAKTCSLVKEKS